MDIDTRFDQKGVSTRLVSDDILPEIQAYRQMKIARADARNDIKSLEPALVRGQLLGLGL